MCQAGWELAPNTAATKCQRCATGTFKPTIGDALCTACGGGRITTDIGTVDEAQCSKFSQIVTDVRNSQSEVKTEMISVSINILVFCEINWMNSHRLH